MSTRPHPESERPLHGPLQRFDLAAEVTRLREEKAWQEGRRNAITLRKGEGLNVVLLPRSWRALSRATRVPPLLEAPEDLIFGLSLENQGDSPPSAAVLKGY